MLYIAPQNDKIGIAKLITGNRQINRASKPYLFVYSPRPVSPSGERGAGVKADVYDFDQRIARV